MLPDEWTGKETSLRVTTNVWEKSNMALSHHSFSPPREAVETVATVVYKRLAAIIAEKHEKPYSQTMQWIRCRLNFSLLRSASMCLRGSRSSYDTTPTPSYHWKQYQPCLCNGQGPIQEWTTHLSKLNHSFVFLQVSRHVRCDYDMIRTKASA